MTGRRRDDDLLTFASLYRAAIWASDLPPIPRLVALAYVNHAGLIYSTDRAWVSYRQMMLKTGIGSPATVSAANDTLTGAGWMVDEGPPPGRPQRVVYRLTDPDPDGQKALDAALAAEQTATAAVADSVHPQSAGRRKTATPQTPNRYTSKGKPLHPRGKTATAAVADVVDVLEVKREYGRTHGARTSSAPTPPGNPNPSTDEHAAYVAALKSLRSIPGATDADAELVRAYVHESTPDATWPGVASVCEWLAYAPADIGDGWDDALAAARNTRGKPGNR